MKFDYVFTIPANTSIDDLYSEDVDINRGLIYHAEIFIPFGHAGLAFLAVMLHENFIYPCIQNTFISGDNRTQKFDDFTIIDQPPFQLKFVGYNEDTAFNHSFYITLYVADKDIFQARYNPILAYDLTEKAMREKELAAQEAEKTVNIILPFSGGEE